MRFVWDKRKSQRTSENMASDSKTQRESSMTRSHSASKTASSKEKSAGSRSARSMASWFWLLRTPFMKTKDKKSYASSRRGKRPRAKGESTLRKSKALSDELIALAQSKDSEIDTSGISEQLDWSKAVVGKFYRPIKKSVTIRLDADVLLWLRSHRGKYQTRINGLLRAAMVRSHKQRKRN